MGCLNSKPVDPDDKEAAQQNSRIEKVIRNDKKTLDRTIKILLLGKDSCICQRTCAWRPLYKCSQYAIGAGESGKSTIIKQMRIIHSGGFPVDERRQNRAVIYSNLIVAFKVLLEIMQAEGIQFTTDTAKVGRSRPTDVETLGANDSFPKEFATLIDKTDPDVSSEEAFSDRKVKDAMEGMWADAGVQKAVARGHEFALHDNLH